MLFFLEELYCVFRLNTEEIKMKTSAQAENVSNGARLLLRAN